MTEDSKNFFIIERLDKDSESENLKNIYDLSVLDKVKEIKIIKKNQKCIKKVKNISQDEKERIIQVVKKTILSANSTYKWRLETFKLILILVHLFIFLSGITSKLKHPQKESLLSIYYHHLYPQPKIEYNLSYNMNETTDNYTINNDTNNNSTNFTNYNQTDIDNKKYSKKFLIFESIFNQILLIPLWLILFHRYIPKWEKVNDAMFKITSHLLYLESLRNKKYFFHLMKNYSIFVVKKKFLLKYKKIHDEIKKEKLFFLDNHHNHVKIKKNMFLYCINIINDFVLEDFAIINYHQLISNEDANDINILIKYMETSLHENLKKYIKKILLPISFLIFISIYNNKSSNIYFILSSLFICVNLLIGQHILKEYYKSYKENIDKFIDNFNVILMQKNRFIYRKDRLIMFFALRSNNYSKNEIINTIKKIIA
jgi:hypothetical protein